MYPRTACADEGQPLLEPGVRLFTSETQRKQLDQLKSIEWQGANINNVSQVKSGGRVAVIDYLGYVARQNGKAVEVLVGPAPTENTSNDLALGSISRNGERRFAIGPDKTVILRPGQSFQDEGEQ